MGLLTRHRLGNVAIDVVLLFAAWYAAFFFRFDVISPYWERLRDAGGWRFVAVQVVVLIALRVYLRQWRNTSLTDVLALGRALLIGGILAYGSMWLFRPSNVAATTRCRAAWSCSIWCWPVCSWSRPGRSRASCRSTPPRSSAATRCW